MSKGKTPMRPHDANMRSVFSSWKTGTMCLSSSAIDQSEQQCNSAGDADGRKYIVVNNTFV